jgi:hypothetical protein
MFRRDLKATRIFLRGLVVYTIPLPFLERSKRLKASGQFGKEVQPIDVEAGSKQESTQNRTERGSAGCHDELWCRADSRTSEGPAYSEVNVSIRRYRDCVKTPGSQRQRREM